MNDSPRFSLLSRCRNLLLRLRQRSALGAAVLAVLVLLGLGGWLAARHLGAWRHYRAGEEALARRNFAEARADAGACLAVWPRSWAAHLLAVRAARRAGDLDGAEAELAACQELRPGPAEETTLEWALLHAQRGGLAPVEEYLRGRLDDSPDDAVPIWEVPSAELMRLRRLPEAQRYLDAWLQARPDDRDALTRRGWVKEHLLDYAAALADYERALDLAPDDDPVRLRVAELLEHQTRLPEALGQYEAVRGRRPDDPAALLGVVRCLRQLGRADEARQQLDVLLAAHQENAPLLHERGRLALDAGQAAEAEPWLRRAAARGPRDREVNYSLYRCLLRLGKTQEALAVSGRLEEIREDEARMRRLMPQVLRRPDDGDLRREIGLIFLRNGYTDDGVCWLQTAVEVDPGNRQAHLVLAEHYEKTGQADLAARHRALAQRAGRQEGGGGPAGR
jgi:tetratricopeptide (TPR) repeat protein